MEGKENGAVGDLEDSKLLFTEEIPKCGRVSIMFYIPDSCKEKHALKSIILQHGGNLAIFHECFTYQISTSHDSKLQDFEEKYYKGIVYSSEWITESAKQGKLLPKDQFIIRKIGKGKELDFEKGKIQYTIREVIIMYEWIKDKKLKNSKRTWQQMVDQGVLLCRTAESLKNFWKTNQKLSVEEWIEALLKKDAKYCHQYSSPIYPDTKLLTSVNQDSHEETKEEESSVKYPVKLTKSQGTPIKSEEEEQIEPLRKKPIINVHENIDPHEDITPLKEEHDYEIHIVSQIDDSEEDEESENNNESEQKVDNEQNDVVEQVNEDDEDESYDLDAEIEEIVAEEIKNEEMLFCSTPPKLKEIDLNEKHIENIVCSQNSLSELFNAYDSNTKNTEKPLKEKKEMLVELLNEDFGDNKFWKSPKSANKKEKIVLH